MAGVVRCSHDHRTERFGSGDTVPVVTAYTSGYAMKRNLKIPNNT